VLVAALEALLETPPLATPEGVTVLDAGAGDGRVLAALGLVVPATRPLRLVGIECDDELHRESCERLAALARRPAWPAGRGAALLHGDWSAPDAFEPLGLELADFDLVLNYPDGDEARLSELLSRRGRPGGRLALIQPEPPREPPGCRLEWSRRLEPGSGPVGWHVSLLAWG
jgi:SAM-dependent methyltransferase